MRLELHLPSYAKRKAFMNLAAFGRELMIIAPCLSNGGIGVSSMTPLWPLYHLHKTYQSKAVNLCSQHERQRLTYLLESWFHYVCYMTCTKHINQKAINLCSQHERQRPTYLLESWFHYVLYVTCTKHINQKAIKSVQPAWETEIDLPPGITIPLCPLYDLHKTH